MKYYLNDYEICTDTHDLLHKGRAQKIEPLVFKLLTYMLENPKRVLTHDELISAAWKHPIFSNSALNVAICAARRALGDTGNKQECIKTVSGIGYRFVAEFTCTKKNNNYAYAEARITPMPQRQKNDVEQMEKRTNVTETTIKPGDEKPPKKLALPDKPSVAVMDFVDMSATQEGVLLAQGLTVDINASLARLQNLFVIARASAASLMKLDLRPKEISRHLGVRYLIYGNTHRLSKRIRVTISIVDATCNTEIWSEHFDRSLDDFFQIQDEITNGAVATIDSKIEQAEIERAFLVPPASLNAWECYHQGLWYINQPTDKAVDMAQQLFQKAILLDPRFSRAYAGLSYTHSSRVLLSVAPSVDDDLSKAIEYAQRSIDCRWSDMMGHISLGRALLLSKKHEQALMACNQAVSLYPNYALGHFVKVFICGYSGFDAQTQRHYDAALRLSPFDPMQFSTNTCLAVSRVHQGKYNEAVNLILRAADDPKAYTRIFVLAAACLELVSRSAEARNYIAKVLKLQPNYSVEIYQRSLSHGDESTNDLFTRAMLGAGLPMASIANN